MKSKDLAKFLAESYGLQFLTPVASTTKDDDEICAIRTPHGTFSHFDDFRETLTSDRQSPFSDQVIFKLVTKGEIHIANRYGEILLPHGSLSLMPWHSQFEEVFSVPTSLYVIGCDRRLAERVIPMTHQYGGYSTQLDTEDFNYLTALIDNHVTKAGKITPMMATLGSEMIIASLSEVLLNSETITRTKKASKRRNILAIKDFIRHHLQDSGLTSQMIADHTRLSVNYMNRLLAEDGLSLMKLVWQMRLEESCRLLQKPLANSLQLAEVAWQCGFNSQSHFSQAFRRQYGMTPKQMRVLYSHPSTT
ncbi:helix-turn-helix transcriptional regulator [Rosenbergiella australiborealis]|uniref:Helix-turn-helix transcriptional regulator n=1 Tax=Rosenbergiella australiborealis TaxID=1544696 RepID=A0ABS5T258_9GAMM|nr:AraC family transcriptional regulator [Rosenbergiella australiborealis]MBT0726428.1 helix-turn-helix transcriptional regulator [Rosenbergiella australiborealis]